MRDVSVTILTINMHLQPRSDQHTAPPLNVDFMILQTEVGSGDRATLQLGIQTENSCVGGRVV